MTRDGGEEMGRRLPEGYVERAVAELLAERDRSGSGGVVAAAQLRHCPGCGVELSGAHSFLQEYWVANETRFLVWCHACHGTWTVIVTERYVGTEATD